MKQAKKINESFCIGAMLALTNDKFLTSKHFPVGLGLDTLTGLKQPVVYLSKLGHFICYKQIEEIETAQAELALKLSNESSILPLITMDNSKRVNDYIFKGFKIWMKKIYARLLQRFY